MYCSYIEMNQKAFTVQQDPASSKNQKYTHCQTTNLITTAMKDADEESALFDPFWEFVLDDYDGEEGKRSSKRKDSNSSDSHWYDSWNENWLNGSNQGNRKVKFRDRVQVEWRMVKEGREPISKERRQHSWTDLSNKPYPLKRSSSETLGRRPATRRSTACSGAAFSYDDSGISKGARCDTWMMKNKRRNEFQRDQPPTDKILSSRKLLGKLICKRVPGFGRRRRSGRLGAESDNDALMPSFTF